MTLLLVVRWSSWSGVMVVVVMVVAVEVVVSFGVFSERAMVVDGVVRNVYDSML